MNAETGAVPDPAQHDSLVPADPAAIAEYERQVVTYEADELATAQRMGRRGWLLSCGLGGLLGLSELRNWGLARELRRMVTDRPVTSVVVGADTGGAYLVRDQVGPPVDIEKALTKHMAWQYVFFRERWSEADDRGNFEVINLCSSDEEQRRFKYWWDTDPTGPRQECGPGGFAQVVTMSDPELKPDNREPPWSGVEYRILRRIQREGSRAVDTRWRINITFGWDKRPIRDDVRLPNPYGFVVTNYARLKEYA